MSLIQIESLPLCPFNFLPLSQRKIAKLDREDYLKFGVKKWYSDKRGYAVRTQCDGGGKRSSFKLHREIMNAPPGVEVDHRDGNPQNNRRENLRLCGRQQNTMNSRLRSDTTTGFKGVSLHKCGQFSAYIHIDKKKRHLGQFPTAEEAHEAYKSAAAQHYGEFANFG